jgi:hypothetical protein
MLSPTIESEYWSTSAICSGSCETIKTLTDQAMISIAAAGIECWNSFWSSSSYRAQRGGIGCREIADQ